jgi:pilus assembly protein Flp/PilA
MRTWAARFFNDDGGTVSIEYGLIAVIVSVGAIVAIRMLGSQVSGTFNAVETEFKKA